MSDQSDQEKPSVEPAVEALGSRGESATLAETIVAAFPQLQRPIVVKQAPLSLIILGTSDCTASETAHLEDQIVRFSAEHGALADPWVFSSKVRQAIDAIDAQADALDTASQTWHRAEADKLSRNPARSRRQLRSIVRECQAALEILRRDSPFSDQLTLRAAAEAVATAIDVLYLTAGVAFYRDHRDVHTFEEHFAASGCFSTHAPFVYLRLKRQAAQARYRCLLGLSQMTSERDWQEDLAEADLLLSEIQRFVYERYTSAEQRRKRRRRIVFGSLGTTGLAIAVSLTALLVARWPLTPLAAGPPTGIGGIQASYYQGMNFEKLLVTREESSLGYRRNFGRVVPTVPQDHFSVRWKGYLRFHEAGGHEICLTADDGVSLMLAGKPIVSTKKNNVRTCETVHVKAGWYPLVVEAKEGTGPTVATIERGRDTDHLAAIPAADLCCKQPQKPAAKRPSSSQPTASPQLKASPPPKASPHLGAQAPLPALSKPATKPQPAARGSRAAKKPQ
ncbi:MAG: hypothetical protein H6707_03330 [Deltaproteobacteria bacterium]|nr:hypothetical protein [Deltaproteobacteria bacterium]